MMHLYLKRFSHGSESTLGLLLVNGVFECFTLEDENRNEKVFGETRIPNGNYELELRKEGGFHTRYARRFPDLHKGMIHLKDVPNFEYVLIHIGNDDSDTAGCILVGDSTKSNVPAKGFVGNSTNAYKRLYKKVSNELVNQKPVILHIDTLRI